VHETGLNTAYRMGSNLGNLNSNLGNLNYFINRSVFNSLWSLKCIGFILIISYEYKVRKEAVVAYFKTLFTHSRKRI
jgi:hypothetical protein